jgi:N-acetylglutamate synthase-like GNAT family acetyltransferase
MNTMITSCRPDDFDSVFRVINDAARVYKGAIPADCWHEPYMSRENLEKEINRGVVFYSSAENGNLAGVMGIQDVQDVTLIRHAYVLTEFQRTGIGGRLLACLVKQTSRPVLMGTWKAATWAISFYQKHGFTLVDEETKNKLLKKYWTIPDRQIETSVVLADKKWIARNL